MPTDGYYGYYLHQAAAPHNCQHSPAAEWGKISRAKKTPHSSAEVCFLRQGHPYPREGQTAGMAATAQRVPSGLVVQSCLVETLQEAGELATSPGLRMSLLRGSCTGKGRGTARPQWPQCESEYPSLHLERLCRLSLRQHRQTGNIKGPWKEKKMYSGIGLKL